MSLKDTANIEEYNKKDTKNETGDFFSLILKIYQKSNTMQMTTIILQQEKALNYLKI